MPTYLPQHSQKGSSILMALWTIGVLLIIVLGLAGTYIREMQLSRTSYDEVLAYANAEGMFEYAMLKVRNHREGFADSVENSELDGKILMPITERSKNMKSSYMIIANSTDYTAQLKTNNHLILPLFSSTGWYISWVSKNPNPESWVQKVTGLEISGLTLSPSNLSWTIVAMSGSESVGLTGSGDITASKQGIIRHKASQCYNGTTWDEISCSLFNSIRGDEELQYFYDEEVMVSEFLENNTDSYLMVFNDSWVPQNIGVTSSTPFALPTLSVRASAQKNDSTQVFEFTEDKSRYYDALKYGVYNTD